MKKFYTVRRYENGRINFGEVDVTDDYIINEHIDAGFDFSRFPEDFTELYRGESEFDAECVYERSEINCLTEYSLNNDGGYYSTDSLECVVICKHYVNEKGEEEYYVFDRWKYSLYSHEGEGVA